MVTEPVVSEKSVGLCVCVCVCACGALKSWEIYILICYIINTDRCTLLLNQYFILTLYVTPKYFNP